MPNAGIKHFNLLIDRKRFSDLPGKNEEGAYGKIIEMSRNDVNTTGNLLDFKLYWMFWADLKDKTTIEQQYFPSLKDQEKLLLSFSKIL